MRWFDGLPTHWTQVKLKRLFHVVNGSTPRTSESSYWSGAIPWVTPDDLGNLESRTITSSSRMITQDGLASCGATLVPVGSLIVSNRAPIGHLAVAGVALSTNQGCKALVPQTELDERYFYYQLSAARPFLKALGQGSTFTELSGSSLSAFWVAAPPATVQRNIADFLDRETAKIDALIDKKQRLLELLEEKRAALITQAVTKGLDPDVEMRDSGVEWLGELPGHWDAVQLKHLASLQTGLTLGQRYDPEELVSRPYLRVANVQAGYLNLDDLTEVEIPRHRASRYELRPGDVLMTEGGDFDKLGRGCVWEGQVPHCLHQNHIFAVRLDEDVLESSFLAAVLEGAYGRRYFTATAKQSTNLASTNSTKVRNFPIAVPPLTEQQEILRYLDRSLGKVMKLQELSSQGIAMLEEYRTAIVSAAVTGKIDVREAAA